ncbi:PPR domain-containing protein/PPR_2 domain-containing protein/PPR_3 domain-containing protein [Cephalotus follicularis]|uniref:PPR domain-containing protein/PPR_2 domain-containing protein/PPR_3 domain-containing protein n=1 Tax=Cephalotus follicularis TaxID=3775 RepID=A0A1Q3C6C8_CEPFO|nr:PPR domain-containing protein/PPR_2 domain-containing protein/PPR_3 domain-containing protein [Cephalotus follicularis]
MYRCGRGIRSLSSTSTSSMSNWDPTKSLELNHPTLILLEKCNTRDHFKQILGLMMRSNLICKTFPMSRLVLFSAVSHPENIDLAILLFNYYTPYPNLYIYNTMISALSNSTSQPFALYNSMLSSSIYPDKHTLLYLLQACKYKSEAKQIHCHAVVTGLLSYGYLQNSLIKKYLENGQMDLALQVFLHIPTPDAASFNIMIVGYAKKGYCLEALELFHEMVVTDLAPDEYTMLGLLVSCGQLRDVRLGKCVHAWMRRRDFINSSNLILCNALLDMYVKCKRLELARRTFDAFKVKDVISWNTIIAGFAKFEEMEVARTLFDQMPSKDLLSFNSLIAAYAQMGDYRMVRELFDNMVAENILPDNVTMINLVSATTEIGALDQGRWIHGRIIRVGMQIDAFLGSALIDMYSKCGSIDRAFMVFREVIEKDVTVWTTMITGIAFHGYGRKALELFSEMQEDLMPNEVTFVAVLTACSHCGLVEEGLNIFNSMQEYYGIEPGTEHYGCLVDLLGRSGRLKEARDVIEKMPMRPGRSTWGAMLSACRAHGDLEMAEKALTELLKLEPEKEGGYIMLSNIYAASGRWSYSDKIREIMECRGVKKTAGCSSIVVDGVIQDFVAADKRHQKWVEIQTILNGLNSEIKLADDFPLDFIQLLREIC